MKVGIIMKTLYFNNFEEFDNAEVAGQFEVVTIVKNERHNTMCADLMTECKSYKTALNRFFKALENYPQFAEWKDGILESCECGYFTQAETYWNDETNKSEYRGGWHYTIEDNDGSFYVCLNVAQ